MKILYATDGSRDAREALQLLQALPLPAGTEVRVLSVITEPAAIIGPNADMVLPGITALEEVRVAERNAAAQAVDEAARALAREGVEVTTSVVEGDPPREIIAAADEWDATVVVVGSKGLTGLDAVLLGSVARNVAKHCRRPVLIGRAPRNGLREVVVATDGSENAQHAVRFAGDFPFPLETHFTAVSVVRPYDPFPGLLPTDREDFDAAVLEVRRQQLSRGGALAADARAVLAAAGKRADSEAREGDPATQILSLAEEKQADVIVAGARGVSLIQGLFVGSVAERLLKEARCSVLMVH
jgi:nucleotide-binding universal stress UspA family protein